MVSGARASVLVGLLVACHGKQDAEAPHAAPPAPPVQQQPQPAAGAMHQPAWLGVRFEPGTTRVVQVVADSPAAQAGLKVDDEVVSLDGQPVTASQEIVKTVIESVPGTTLKVALTRAGAPMTIAIKLAPRPPDIQLVRESLLDKPAPDFTATGLDGAQVKLADLRGQVVLVDFWATWCGPCSTQYPHLNQWHQQYGSKGLRILALSDEEPAYVKEFVTEEKLAYPIALDPEDRIRAQYLVPGMPTTVIVDKAGVVRYVTVGTADPAEIEAAFTRLLP